MGGWALSLSVRLGMRSTTAMVSNPTFHIIGKQAYSNQIDTKWDYQQTKQECGTVLTSA